MITIEYGPEPVAKLRDLIGMLRKLSTILNLRDDIQDRGDERLNPALRHFFLRTAR